MAENRLEFKLKAVNETKKAFDEAKKDAKELEKTLSKKTSMPLEKLKFGSDLERSISKSIHQLRQVQKEMFKTAPGKMAAEKQMLPAAIPQLTTDKRKSERYMIMSLRYLKDLRDIAKRTGQYGVQSYGKPGVPIKPGEVPEGATGGSLKGTLGKVALALGGIGIAVGAMGYAWRQMSRAATATRSVFQAQLPTIQTLGFGGKAAGLFTGSEQYAVTPTEEAGFMRQYGTQILGKTIGQSDVGRMRGESRKRFETAAMMKAAYGLDISESGRMMGMVERFSSDRDIKAQYQTTKILGKSLTRQTAPARGFTGDEFMMYATGRAEKAGMGGARLQEFLGDFEQSMASAISAGFNVTGKEMVDSLSNLMSTKDEKLKTLAPKVLQSAMGVFAESGQLQGGPGSSIALQAVWSSMKKGTTLEQARKEMTRRKPEEVMRTVIGYMEKFGGSKEMTRDILMKTGIFGQVASIDQQEKMLTGIKEGKSFESGTVKETVEEGKKAIGKRLPITEEITRQAEIGRVFEELRSMTTFGRGMLEDQNKILKGITDIIQKIGGSGLLKRSAQEASAEPKIAPKVVTGVPG